MSQEYKGLSISLHKKVNKMNKDTSLRKKLIKYGIPAALAVMVIITGCKTPYINEDNINQANEGIAHVQEEPADHHGPEGKGLAVTQAVGTKIQGNLVFRRKQPERFTPSPDKFHRIDKTQEHAGIQDGHLNDIGIDNRLHAPEKIVHNSDGSQKNDRRPEGHAHNLLKHDGNAVHRHTGAKGPHYLEQHGQERPRAHAEPFLEVFVNRYDVDLAKEGK